LSALFPAGAVAVEMTAHGDPAGLLPAEVPAVARAVAGRVREFAAGRRCARRALAEFGVGDVAIAAAADRQPVWPPGMAGSITHTAGLCAAVVAPTRRLAALGLDCEVVGHVSADIWDTICVADEASWIDSLSAAGRPAAVALLFSAKEAFYKCQYPLAEEWLDFHDLRITPETWGTDSGAFRVSALRPLALSATNPAPWVGRYLFHDGYVSTGISLARYGCQDENEAASKRCRPGTP